jgi:hypothetical protein
MNLFEMAKIPLNKAIEVMKLDPSAADIIATPERTLEVSIPVRMDDGTTKVSSVHYAPIQKFRMKHCAGLSLIHSSKATKTKRRNRLLYLLLI